jgi:hypothetical protein
MHCRRAPAQIGSSRRSLQVLFSCLQLLRSFSFRTHATCAPCAHSRRAHSTKDPTRVHVRRERGGRKARDRGRGVSGGGGEEVCQSSATRMPSPNSCLKSQQRRHGGRSATDPERRMAVGVL